MPKDLAQGTCSRACCASPASCTPPKTAATCSGSCAARSSASGARRYARPETAPMPQEPEMLPDLKVASPESTIKSVELHAAISRLPDHFPPALVAVDVLGLSYAEAARALRVCNGTMTSRLHRAPTRLPGSCSVVCRRELRRSSTTRSGGRSTGPAQDGGALRHLPFRLPARLPAAKLRW